MEKKDIQGVYLISAQIYNKGPALADGSTLYEYTNNNRDANVGSAFECKLEFIQLNSFGTSNFEPSRKFIQNNKLLIKRVRISTPGSPGLQPSPGTMAARMILTTYATNAQGVEVSGNGLSIDLIKFNEWQDFNVWFDNFKIDSADGSYEFKLPAARWSFHVDDYNLQSAYEGEPLKAFLELEIDTSGLMVKGSNKIV